MRDKLKDGTYFEEYIAEEEARLRKYIAKLESGTLREDRILPVRMGANGLRMGILLAKYSMGVDVSELKTDFEIMFKEWVQLWKPDSYIGTLWMISLSVLFELEESQMRRIKELLVNAEIDDWLYDFLLDIDRTEKNDDTPLRFPQVYGELKVMAQSDGDRTVLLQEYMKGWYERHKSCGWHDSHKEKQKLYYGYWSLEAGAMAKTLGIPDESLKETPFYPYDLVHWSEE